MIPHFMLSHLSSAVDTSYIYCKDVVLFIAMISDVQIILFELLHIVKLFNFFQFYDFGSVNYDRTCRNLLFIKI